MWARRREEARLKTRDDEYKSLSGKELIVRANDLADEVAGPELVIQLRMAVEARANYDKTFPPGAALGRAYLYAPKERRFVSRPSKGSGVGSTA